MKKIALALLCATAILFSCTKQESKGQPDKNSPFYDTLDHRHASIEGGVVVITSFRNPDLPVYVSMPTVVMIAHAYNNFVIDFVFSYVPNTLNGGGPYMSNNWYLYGADYSTGIRKVIPGIITSWRNYPGSNLIYFTVKAKYNYWVPIAADITGQNMIADLFFDGVYNTLTGKFTMTSRVVTSYPSNP